MACYYSRNRLVRSMVSAIVRFSIEAIPSRSNNCVQRVRLHSPLSHRPSSTLNEGISLCMRCAVRLEGLQDDLAMTRRPPQAKGWDPLMF